MSLDWDGYAVKLVDIFSTKADTVENRVNRQILWAGVIGVAVIIAWKVLK